MNVNLPGARAWPDCPREFYVFFQQLAGSTNQTAQTDLTDLTRRLSALETATATGGSVRGAQSVRSVGVLPNIVTFTLTNDSELPGNAAYYGTGPTGAKGWQPIASALATTADTTLTVGDDGVSTLGLADLANTGTGVLLAITRDAKGRVSGSRAATTTDLAEGDRLYYTDTRADARIAAFKATFAALPNAADDAAAAAAGVAVGSMYRNGSTLSVRIA